MLPIDIECKPIENRYTRMVHGQRIAVLPTFTLESGIELHNVPVAYKTWGNLSERKNNAIIVCHGLTESADIEEWWEPLLGRRKALDTSKFFIICMNSLGSPYGTASPVTPWNGIVDNDWYGPEFPLTTIRDDVRLHKSLLEELGVCQVAAVIGGSLGGMIALEWAYIGKDYVRCIMPIATSGYHSAWGIGWGEAQRQSVYSDSSYNSGYYSDDRPPIAGLAAARMGALLTYRSRDSLQRRFGRSKSTLRPQWTSSNDKGKERIKQGDQFQGNRPNGCVVDDKDRLAKSHSRRRLNTNNLTCGTRLPLFAAQSHLQHLAREFTDRFDSNCYIALTRKMDTHDLCRDRADTLSGALSLIQQPTLVLGTRSDILFPFAEQEEIACHVPNSQLVEIVSDAGHAAFLIELEQVNRAVSSFLLETLPDLIQNSVHT